MGARSAVYYGEKAAFCRRLAKEARLPEVLTGLEELAVEFEAAAKTAEQGDAASDESESDEKIA